MQQQKNSFMQKNWTNAVTVVASSVANVWISIHSLHCVSIWIDGTMCSSCKMVLLKVLQNNGKWAHEHNDKRWKNHKSTPNLMKTTLYK